MFFQAVAPRRKGIALDFSLTDTPTSRAQEGS